jgi:hypothetical protein
MTGKISLFSAMLGAHQKIKEQDYSYRAAYAQQNIAEWTHRYAPGSSFRLCQPDFSERAARARRVASPIGSFTKSKS